MESELKDLYIDRSPGSTTIGSMRVNTNTDNVQQAVSFQVIDKGPLSSTDGWLRLKHILFPNREETRLLNKAIPVWATFKTNTNTSLRD